MAEIYKKPKGVRSRGRDPLNYVVAHHREVQSELKSQAMSVFQEAEAILQSTRGNAKLEIAEDAGGRARILYESGDVDQYIILEDPAALSIEFGRSRTRGVVHSDKAVAPVAPLRKAGGLL